jgi:hypothetical protein
MFPNPYTSILFQHCIIISNLFTPMNILNGLYIKIFNILKNFDIKGSYITYMYSIFFFLVKHH